MRFPVVTAAIFALAACTPAEPGAQVAGPARVTTEQFRTIGWMTGRWRGTGPDGAPFYESYQLADDSTLKGHTWADSTFAKVADSSVITLRGGEVRSGVAPNGYVVTSWAGDAIRFDPRGTSANGFTWAKLDTDHWLATLTWTDRQGRAQQRVYRMVRVGG
jgi:hypothetical protein